MKKITLILIAFMFIGHNAYSQWAIMRSDADSLVRAGVDYIYNVKFDKAEENFTKVKQLYPEHPAGYFLDAMVDWWKITLYRGDKRYDKSFLSKIDKVVQVCDKLLLENSHDINALFFKAGAIGYRGRFHAERENWVSAARDGAAGYDLLIQCSKIAPGNHDIMLGTGIYNYFAAVFPEKYSILKPLMVFLPRGDKTLGILQLNSSRKNARYSSVEASVVLLQIYYTFENDLHRAIEIAEELNGRYPDNPYFHRYLGRVYVRRGLNDMYEKTWRDILIKSIANKPGYERTTAREAMYYIGFALYEKGEYEDALRYFYKCDEGSRVLDKPAPSGFMVMSNLYIGRILDIQGKRNYAIKQYEKILKMKDYDNSHAEAQKFLKTPFRR